MRDLRFDPLIKSGGAYKTTVSRSITFVAWKKGIQLPTKIIMDRVKQIRRTHYRVFLLFLIFFRFFVLFGMVL